VKESDFGPISDTVLAFGCGLRQTTTRRRVLGVPAEIRMGHLTIRNLKLYCRIQIFWGVDTWQRKKLVAVFVKRNILLRFRRVRKIEENSC